MSRPLPAEPLNRHMPASAVVIVLALAIVATAAPAHAAGNVCQGAARGCRYVASSDVDGDGRRDDIAVVRRDDRSSIVRVLTARGRVVGKVVDTKQWAPDDVWHGAAAIDGRPGKELVVAHSHGAHTLFFRVLTLRRGALEFLPSPGGGRTWTIDGSWAFNMGVWRHVEDGSVYVTLRSSERDDDGVGHHGLDARYRWRKGGWHRVWMRTRRYGTDREAFRIAGWHVRGLPRI